MFILFAAPMFIRLLPADGNEVRPDDAAKIDALFGSEDRRHIYGARLAGKIEPGEARDQYLNLMRWLIETELEYKWTHPLAIRNVSGHEIYSMIFATDHEAGTRIMSNIYANAAAEFPAMRQEARRVRNLAREQDSGVMSLFPDERSILAPVKSGERFYEHEPPTPPWFLK